MNLQHLPDKHELKSHLDFSYFVELIRVLRAPGGCPWDQEQTHSSIKKNVIEEAYEVAQAIELGRPQELCDELGDLLEQVVLHAQIAQDAGTFDIDDVCRAVTEKMVRRHPHVFIESKEALDRFYADNPGLAEVMKVQLGEGLEQANSGKEVLNLWDQVKLMEKELKRQELNRSQVQAAVESIGREASSDATPALAQPPKESIMDSIPYELPALMQADKISRKAASIGFEWNTIDEVWQMVDGEIQELKDAAPGTQEQLLEMGDVFFSLVNIARKLGIDPEAALRAANQKFMNRFRHMEKLADKQGRTLQECKDDFENFWEDAKRLEKNTELQ